ncbi:hypothetical protein [Roseovarius sp. MBR-6]|uniref:hypothetical protein n=1 Tax=Roseovarius sp. MBR-6 TaxID=3156459 RepID=UPI0033919E15
MNSVIEIIIERWRFQERQCFYAFSAAGAAIGYAIVTSSNLASGSAIRFLMAALILWTFSMLCGLKLLSLLSLAQRMSLAAMRLKGNTAELKIADTEFIHDDKIVGRKISCYRNLQVIFLLIGALVYLPSVVDFALAFDLTPMPADR